jgi:hypothetical protein
MGSYRGTYRGIQGFPWTVIEDAVFSALAIINWFVYSFISPNEKELVQSSHPFEKAFRERGMKFGRRLVRL